MPDQEIQKKTIVANASNTVTIEIFDGSLMKFGHAVLKTYGATELYKKENNFSDHDGLIIDIHPDGRHKKPSVVKCERAGLFCEPFEGNGHLLYRAIGHYVGISESELKKDIKESLKRNPEKYEAIFQEYAPHTAESYIANLDNNLDTDDRLEYKIAAIALNKPIAIISHMGVLAKEINAESNGEPIFIQYNGKRHYNGLENRGRKNGHEILTFLKQESTATESGLFSESKVLYKTSEKIPSKIVSLYNINVRAIEERFYSDSKNKDTDWSLAENNSPRLCLLYLGIGGFFPQYGSRQHTPSKALLDTTKQVVGIADAGIEAGIALAQLLAHKNKDNAVKGIYKAGEAAAEGVNVPQHVANIGSTFKIQTTSGLCKILEDAKKYEKDHFEISNADHFTPAPDAEESKCSII